MQGPDKYEDPLYLRARQRVLLFILKKGRKYRANVSQVARDMRISVGDVQLYIQRLKQMGYLKEVQRGGVNYFRVTWKGVVSLFPVLVTKWLTYFMILIAISQLIWAGALISGYYTISPAVLMVISSAVILAFSAIMLWGENRLEGYLLEARRRSND